MITFLIYYRKIIFRDKSFPLLPACLFPLFQIDVQLYILSFLSPHDLCQLGSTSHYWNETVRDPILWRYFLLRDLPSWSSVDWKSLPDLDILKKPMSEVTDGAFFDYMAV